MCNKQGNSYYVHYNIKEVSDQWAVGRMGCRTNGLSNQWAVEPMGCRTTGKLPKFKVCIGDLTNSNVLI